jgi:hypothetical protein
MTNDKIAINLLHKINLLRYKDFGFAVLQGLNQNGICKKTDWGYYADAIYLFIGKLSV